MNIPIFMVFCIFFIEGFSMLLENIILVYKSMLAKNWPTTMGNIQSLSLQTRTIESPRYSVNHEVKVTYNYFIHGEMYIGSQIAFGYCGGDNLRSQQALMDKLRSTSAILVRYNPKDSRISTLSFGIHRSIKQGIFNGFWILGFMSCMISSSPIALLYGFIVFIFCFIISTILDYRTDNTIIQNIINSSAR